MDYSQIIDLLKSNKTTFNEIRFFSNQPGIYAIYFYGDKFADPKLPIKKHELIYIGKTESSQQSRDANTHFKSGKTGSSTVRRTVGALLREELKLIPVPRNSKDLQKGRITFYKFNDYSEERLTIWMKNNLSLSFYEYPKPSAEIDYLETELIKITKPIFNLSKNSDNPFGSYIKAKRKACGQIAHGQSKSSLEKPESPKRTYTPSPSEVQFSPKSQFTSFSDSRSNPKNKYKLHEAMEIILKNRFKRRATIQSISDEIAKKDLYRKKDGGYAGPGQIKLRAKNYSQFEISGDMITFIE